MKQGRNSPHQLFNESDIEDEVFSTTLQNLKDKHHHKLSKKRKEKKMVFNPYHLTQDKEYLNPSLEYELQERHKTPEKNNKISNEMTDTFREQNLDHLNFNTPEQDKSSKFEDLDARFDTSQNRLTKEQLNHMQNEPLLEGLTYEREKQHDFDSEVLKPDKLSILGNLSQSKIFQVQLKTLYYLIPNIFSTGDFLIAVVILKLLISSTKFSALKSATEYHNSILEVLVYTFNFGLNETLGIFGSQAYSKGKKERLRLLLEQAIRIGIGLFAVVSIPVWYLSKDFLKIYGTGQLSEETAGVFANLVLYSLPGVFLKIITDCYKTFVYCQGKYFLLGGLCFINLILMTFYSHFFIVVMEWNHFGYGLSLFLLEMGNVAICIYFHRNKIDPRCRRLRYRLNFNRSWFTCQWIKNSFTEYHFWITIELSAFTLSLIGSQKQIQAYSILVHILNAFIAIAYGMNVYPRTKINYCIGKKERIVAKRKLFDFVSAYVVICFLTNVGSYYLLKFIFSNVVEDELTRKWLLKSLIWFCVVTFLNMMLPVINSGLRSIDKKIHLITVNTLFSIILMPVGIYWLSITAKFELIGIYVMMILETSFRMSVNYFTLLFANWEKFNIIY